MESSLRDIFNAPLVRPAVDRLWDERSIPDIIPCDTLVISTPYAPESDAALQLMRMLGACKLSASDFAVVQVAPDQIVAWHLLKAHTGATKVLLLGVPPVQLGIHAMMTLHEINHFNGVQWMVTTTLDEISTNAPLKQHLWTHMLKKVYFPES